MMEPLTKLRLLALAAKYRIEMIYHAEGHIIVRINNWHLIDRKIDDMVHMFAQDPAIYSIRVDSPEVDITYDPNILFDQAVIQRWLGAIEQFNL